MSEEIVAGVQRIFEEVLGVPAPAPDMDLIEAELLDSLGLVTLLFGIEQEFGVEVPLESLEIDQLRTILSIADLLGSTQPAR
jgi:acyl carrier protein